MQPGASAEIERVAQHHGATALHQSLILICVIDGRRQPPSYYKVLYMRCSCSLEGYKSAFMNHDAQ